MKKLLAAIVLMTTFQGWSQTGTVKTKTQLDTQTNSTIYPNGSNLINATADRQLRLDVNASLLNRQTDEKLLNLRDYDATATHIYKVGECCLHNKVVKRCKVQTSGAYNAAHWEDVTYPTLASWGLTGNAGIDTTLNFIGTQDSFPLIFRTDSVERFRITGAGNFKPIISAIGATTDSIISRDPLTGFLELRPQAAGPTGPTGGTGATGAAGPTGPTGSVAGTAWGITGNAGTNITTNFIGTTDANGLKFKINNGHAGLISLDASPYNTSLGYGSFGQITSGEYNTGLGISAGLGVSTGNNNVAVGYSALSSITGGSDNVAVGYYALGSANPNTSGNVAVGSSSGINISSGISNTMVGLQTGGTVQAGNYNTLVGVGADVLTDIDKAVAIGFNSKASSRTFVAGSDDGNINDVYFGAGINSASPPAVTIHGSGGLGTDIQGGGLTIAAGLGTGNAVGSVIELHTPDIGASGATDQNTTKRLEINQYGNIRAFTLHNNASSHGDSLNQDIRSGSYTPTLTNTTNVSASTAYICHWSRIGNHVTVTGQLDIDPTIAATSSRIDLSIPVPSAFWSDKQCGGTASGFGIAGMVGGFIANTSTGTAQLRWISSDVTNQTWSFCFGYDVK